MEIEEFEEEGIKLKLMISQKDYPLFKQYYID
jgi:hypothetical protein